MTVGVPTCPPDVPLLELARRMLEKDWEAVVVLAKDDGHALGVVSRAELVRAATRPDASELQAEQVMTDGLPQVPPEIPLTSKMIAWTSPSEFSR